MKIKAIVIDDEENNRNLIIRLITQLSSSYEIVDEAFDVQSGYKCILQHNPQVVFLDLSMPDGTGFDLLAMFEKLFFEIVFITAHDNYAVKAFKFNAVDYILKPIDSEAFKHTLMKVEARVYYNEGKSEELKTMLSVFNNEFQKAVKIPVHSSNKVILIDARDVVIIRSQEGNSQFKLISNEIYYSSKNIGSFDSILHNLIFMIKVNKGTYVNLNYIKGYTKGITCFLILIDGTELEVSRRKKGEILEILSNLKL